MTDSLEGVTHALRTNEYHDRNDQFYWFIDKLKIRKPFIWDYSRMNFIFTLLSKRKLTWFVDQKRVEGWDDPRFPTIRGVLRRGLTVEALKEYIYMQGPSKNILLLEWDKLWAVNRKVIDPITPRFTAVTDADRVKVHIAEGPATPYSKEIPKHKKNPDLGNKMTVFASTVLLDAADAAEIEDNEELTLMDWGNIIVTAIHKDATGKVTSIDAKANFDGDFKKTKKKITWLADTEKTIPLTLLDFDFLITKKKMEEEDNFEDFLNPHTVFEVPAHGDANLASLKKGDRIQIERKGYYICDEDYKQGSPLKLILIPDGKAKTTGVEAEANKTVIPANTAAKGAKSAAPASTKGAKAAAAAPASATGSSSSSSSSSSNPQEFAKAVSGMYYLPPIKTLSSTETLGKSVSGMYHLPSLDSSK